MTVLNWSLTCSTPTAVPPSRDRRRLLKVQTALPPPLETDHSCWKSGLWSTTSLPDRLPFRRLQEEPQLERDRGCSKSGQRSKTLGLRRIGTFLKIQILKKIKWNKMEHFIHCLRIQITEKSLVPNYMLSISRIKRTSANFFCSYSQMPFGCILLIKYCDLKK